MEKTWLGCAPGNFTAGRRGFRPEAIVIHIMEGTIGGTDSWFNDPRSSVSAHYGVGRNGQIHQYVAETDTAYHAGIIDSPSWTGLKKTPAGVYINPNYYTIGIEHEGFAADTWPQAQIDASKTLIAEIAERWNIARDDVHVIGHHAIRAAKSCPGTTIKIGTDLLNGQAPERPAIPPTVTTVVNANLRSGLPSTSALIARVLPAGTVMKVVDCTGSGEPVRGNPWWYQDEDGNYLWAGATSAPHPQSGIAEIGSYDRPAFDQLKQEYSDLYHSCALKPGKAQEVDAIIGKISRQRPHYENAAQLTPNKVPWFVIAIIHSLEASLNLNGHLHNGDPLTAPTVHVPRGRPPGWGPPYEWERSAADALDLDGFTRWNDWSVAGICYKLEGYNGWGSRRHGINTPYLWSYCQHYSAGKYVADGKWSATTVSNQCGGAVLLHAMADKNIVQVAE